MEELPLMMSMHWLQVTLFTLIATIFALSNTADSSAPPASPLEMRDQLLQMFDHHGAAAAPALAEALEDERPLVRRTAAHLLARLGEPGRDKLQTALAHSDPQMRRIAIEAMGREWILDQYLEETLTDEDPVLQGWAWGYLSREIPQDPAEREQLAGELGRLLMKGTPLQRDQAIRLLAHWEFRSAPLYDLFADGSSEQLRRWNATLGTGAGRPASSVEEYLHDPVWEGVTFQWTATEGLHIQHDLDDRVQLRTLPVELRNLDPGPYKVEFSFRQEFPSDAPDPSGISLRISGSHASGTDHFTLGARSHDFPERETLSDIYYFDPGDG